MGSPSTDLKSKIVAPFTFSQSSLQDYVDCQRRFQLRYIEQMDWPAVESEPVVENEMRQQEGRIFHRLVHQHLLDLPADRLQKSANTPNLARWWRNWLEFRSSTDFGDPLPEFTLSCPIGEHRLLATYDLLAATGGKAIIYDWKTYAKRPRDEWLSARWQTRVYPALLVQAGSQLNGGKPFVPEQIKLEYWFADFPTEPAKFQYSASQFRRDWSGIEKTVQEISSARDFPLTEDRKMCVFCVYRSYCDRGTQAGDGENAESAVHPQANFDIQFEQIEEIEF